MQHQINQQYTGCCEQGDTVQLAAMPDDYQAYINQLIRKIWLLKTAPVIDEVLLNTYSDKLIKAVIKGYGKDVPDTDWDTPDYELQNKLKTNVWQFSAAKTHTQLRDMSQALQDANGSIRPYADFKREAERIAGQQLNWLRTEYDTAVGSSQMSAKWQQIEQQKKLFPFLEFDAVIDKHTSDLCGSLNGVIRPVDDAFWKQYYPPNHFNCRSTVRQLRKGDITPDDKIVYPEKMPAMFKVNLGERGLVFPEDHAYYIDMPDDVWQEARKLAPYNMQFDKLAESDKLRGKVRQHFLTDTTGNDYQRIYQEAIRFATEGKVSDIMPTLAIEQQPETYRIVFKGANAGKQPDLKVGNTFIEEAAATKSYKLRNIKNAIDDNAKQAKHLIINLMYPNNELARVAKSAFIDHKDLAVIEFNYQGNYTRFNRGDFIKS